MRFKNLLFTNNKESIVEGLALDIASLFKLSLYTISVGRISRATSWLLFVYDVASLRSGLQAENNTKTAITENSSL